MADMGSFRVSSAADRVAHACGWVTVAGLTVAAVVRASRTERHPAWIAAQSVSAWLSIPAGVVAAWAVVRGKTTLAAVSVPLSVGLLRLTMSTRAVGLPVPARPGSTTVRLVSANVLERNPLMGAYAEDLISTGADVIVLQEITPDHVATAGFARLLDAYPHSILDPQVGYNGSAIVSRLPMSDRGYLDVGGQPMTRADLVTPAGPLRIVNVHAVAPVTRGRIAVWRRQLATLATLEPPTGGDLVLAGDFNATLDHRSMASLLHHGLRDAFVEAGTGLGATWPRWRGLLPPLMRIDHVMVSPQVTVLSTRLDSGPGSDHRRLVADLALTPE
jgi:endonuclease/exonuclease/phosphatase (EEP) superfamily protein YafD